MGASVTAAVVAIGALAYALTLEGRILTNDARSLSTCNAVSFLKAYEYVLRTYLPLTKPCIFNFFFQLNTITSNTLTAIPAVTAAGCGNIVTTNTVDQSANIITCLNQIITSINANAVTPINAYGNPTC